MFKDNKKHVKTTQLDVVLVSRYSSSSVSSVYFEYENTRCNRLFVSY